ncbi:MAG: L,D-transpeptidase family protein [Cyclobacteriaceae bacterium]
MYYIRLLVFSLLIYNTSFAQIRQDDSNELRIKVEQLGGQGLTIGKEKVSCRLSIQEFYQKGLFTFIWTEPTSMELIQAVKDSYDDGLNPEDYHLELLQSYQNKEELSPTESSNFELLLTDSFLLLATHLMSGKVNPHEIDSEWKVVRREGNPLDLLAKCTKDNTVLTSLNDAKPQYKAYDRLKEKLKRYRAIAEQGGWPSIESDLTLKLSMRSVAVSALRERLEMLGDMPILTNDEPDLFDEDLFNALKKYQKRHGIESDGSVGKETLKCLNVTIEERIKDLLINLERCRWLPNELGDHYIMINLPAFEMELVKDGNVELEMDVVVGKPLRQTTVFSSNLIYLVLNPYWTVPPTILYQDMIPAQIKNPNHIQNLSIKVISENGSEINPEEIDWEAIKKHQFPYILRQEPGPNNALGVVKFIFPNPYNIYMHDTNHREVFVRTERAMSSGCVRLSRPLDLAYYLLAKQNPPLSKEKVDELVKTTTNKSINLQLPLQVHLQYWTSFVDETGQLNFRKDIYSRNKKLLSALTEKSSEI